MFAKVYPFLGSIKLAVPLLSAIATILIGATFYETQVGSAAVQQLIYKSPWFGALMLMLAVNLGVSALSRYPWKGARKIGFALAHLGLIVLIAGSAAVIHLGAEGMLVLRTDGPPQHQLSTEGDMLEVAQWGQEPQQTLLRVNPDQSVSPAQFNGLSLLGYRDHVVETIQFAEGGAVPNRAVQLQLNSDRMGQSTQVWLADFPRAYRQTTLGPAQLELVQAEDDQQLQQLLSESQNSVLGRWGQMQIETRGKKQTLDVEQALDHPLKLDRDLQVTVSHVWPDFRLNNQSQPITISQELRNPVLGLEVQHSTGVERWYVFAQEGFDPVRTVLSGTELSPNINAQNLEITYQTAPLVADRLFRVVADSQGQIFYGLRSAQEFTSEPLVPGQPVQTGWADFQITLVNELTQAQVQRQVVPSDQEGSPGLLVTTPTGAEQWLPWGEPSELNDAAGAIFAFFSPRSLALPFDLGLEDFIVERNEGDESVAMWTSKVKLQDPHTGSVEHRDVWMNHPTWYQGWKIAQASWNPGDLNQSTLQVKREPLWVTALTWSGALLVVSGISTMFYGKHLGKYWRTMTSGPTERFVEEDAMAVSKASPLGAGRSEPLANSTVQVET
ncbi:Cytochrome c biogenesis protein Ccs1 [Acaryochloris thomasi RCC1774]|uniref:Cytochrome c biogenesis protein Ccs1 n=1 Tax=Acaryochloris thomasi RCC1774 TaxID=1764569 RepID=A0A2W1JYD4_9CYAN|nr:cytochrome c biogenesis protein ResB [Acaryochloris thomasi]PZD75022.1 Cytochrome c biogenesis protein Ccs1 [Acaryochloris thomasi RCC1774]